jgi:hypothetical protein
MMNRKKSNASFRAGFVTTSLSQANDHHYYYYLSSYRVAGNKRVFWCLAHASSPFFGRCEGVLLSNANVVCNEGSGEAYERQFYWRLEMLFLQEQIFGRNPFR